MAKKEKLKIIPLGGLDEVGKNMTAFEYGEDIVVVDCGLAFPDDEMLGIDLVIPDITYLVKNAERVRGIVLTHGHEDHIGALPYVLRQLSVPVYGTRLTLGIVNYKLEEHGMTKLVNLNLVKTGDRITLGCFKIEFIRVNHSIPDAAALAIDTPVGMVVHTGDFKIDSTPIQGDMIDLTRFGELGKHGVLALLADSTNVERPGHSMSESKVRESFDGIFKHCESRIVVASFASNVHRIQQVIDASVKYGRKVAFSGRSMVNIVRVALQLGIIQVSEGVIVDIDAVNRLPKNRVTIVTTGSQGEPMSALYRMAFSDHKKVELGPDDLVVISASPIPGNEKTVSRVINELFKLGAEVIYESLAEVHASGHACQEEHKLMMALVKPRFFVPVHGEYRHLKKHAGLAKAMGMDMKNILIPEIGKVIELDKQGIRMTNSVPSGRVLVDGLGVGDVGNIVLRDRKHLAQDGLIVVVATIDGDNGTLVAGPDIVSRGFVYVREAEDLMEQVRRIAKETLQSCEKSKVREWNTIKGNVKNALSEYLYERTKRKPMILPVIMEV